MINKSFYVGLVVIAIFALTVIGAFQIYRSRSVQNETQTTQTPQAEEQGLEETGFAGITEEATPTPTPPVLGANTPQIQPESGSNTQGIQNPGITVTDPNQNSQVSSPVKVTGHANVLGSTVSVVIRDSLGRALGLGNTTACFGYNSCPFEASIVFQTPQTPTGVIEVYSPSTFDSSKKHLQIIPVTF